MKTIHIPETQQTYTCINNSIPLIKRRLIWAIMMLTPKTHVTFLNVTHSHLLSLTEQELKTQLDNAVNELTK